MSDILDNIADRLRHFIMMEGLSMREFSRRVGFSHGLLSRAKSIGSEKLEHICTIFPNLNPTWVLTGNGEMYQKPPSFKQALKQKMTEDLKKEDEPKKQSLVEEPAATYNTPTSDERIKSLESQLKEKDKRIEDLKSQIEFLQNLLTKQ